MMSNTAEDMERLMARARSLHVPGPFVFGAATAAYQIEGAPKADGKGESIWDRFTRQTGVIVDDSTGDVACDHYRRWPEDIRLMRELGLGAYRFSLAWPRIQPDGAGKINAAGLDFYKRLIDGLTESGIEPFLTLYHWDLPQALQDRGGWYSRETSHRFADYADLVSRALTDRVQQWTTLNEPWTFCWSGYATGEDAPGLKDGAKGGLSASHHALLAHGLAVPAIRANVEGADIGIVLDLNTVIPASDKAADVAAAGRFEAAQNRWFLDALFKGRYPETMLDLCGGMLPEIRAGDSEIIAAPLDYLGVNIYRRSIMAAGSELPPLNFERVNPPGRYSAVKYEVWPESIEDILVYVHEQYGPKAIYISENGFATTAERVTPDGAIHDVLRAEYHIDHLDYMARAMRRGVPVKGYFAWTLMDNFEWAYGYSTPFGIVHVDFADQTRRIKFSGHVYAAIARNSSASQSAKPAA
ncbi:beta-glucosidase [Nordella sp. HKS 07]|uniref:GH1 family beta-glucosidase n=1 Tax=Nordella sp. HKS 07 TaxID=2712222 RepID=UPI0013E10919|nr:GH1 family beta-glucosidase [Nordella sp. HKS 07]QIG51130.1 beta-glucosidase [Nordella sp. HKS 07]